MFTVILTTHIDVSSIWKDVQDLWKNKPLKSMVQEQNGRKGAVHKKEQETTNENHIDMVNINSISLDYKQSVIVAK